MRRLVPRLLLAGAVLALLPVVSVRADGSDTSLIHACQAPPRGGVTSAPRLVSADSSCRGGETAVHWPATVPPAPKVLDATNTQVGTYLGTKEFTLETATSHRNFGSLPLVHLTDGSRDFGALVSRGRLFGTWTGASLFFTGPSCTGLAFRPVGDVVTSGILPLHPPTFAALSDPRLWVADLTLPPSTRTEASVLVFDLLTFDTPCQESLLKDHPDTVPFVEVTVPFTPPFRLVIE
jgi:hypothetical protein